MPLEPPLNMMHLHKKMLLKLSIENLLISKQWIFVGPKLDLPFSMPNKIVVKGHQASLEDFISGK
jgi:hypothetical protein